MTDDVDHANEVAERFREQARQERPKVEPLPPIGSCYECGDDVPGDLRWCSPACRNDFEAAQEAERRRAMANGRGE